MKQLFRVSNQFVTENKIWDIFLLRNFRENPWYTIDHLVLWKLFQEKGVILNEIVKNET